MAEFVSVPGSLHGEEGAITDAVIQALAEQGVLPADLQFRALSISDERRRGSIVRQDILAAIGQGEPSGHPYLTDPLPDCVFVPGVRPVRDVIREVVDVDYHQLDTMRELARGLETQPNFIVNTWLMYITHLDPARAEELGAILEPGQETRAFAKEKILKMILSRTIIRSSALLEIYNTPNTNKGRESVRKELLRRLLADDHPELYPDLAP